MASFLGIYQPLSKFEIITKSAKEKDGGEVKPEVKVGGQGLGEEEYSLVSPPNKTKVTTKENQLQCEAKVDVKKIILNKNKNHGRGLKYEAKVEDKKVILDSKYRDSKKTCKIKFEPMMLEENSVNNESKIVKDDSISVNKGSPQASVKSTRARRLDSKVAVCDVCSKTFANMNSLKTHMKIPHRCIPKKDELTTKKNELKTKFVTCATCGQDRKARWILKHEKLCRMSEDERAAYNATLKVECEKCYKILSNGFKLARHIKTVHNESKQFQCEHCDHMDNRSDNMKTHVKNNHSVLDTR